MTTQAVYKWPESWPSRIIGWLIALVAFLVLAALLAVCVTAGYYELTRTKSSDVETMISAELPERANTDQIFDFFEAHGMTYGSARPSTSEDQKPANAGVPEGTMTITGTLPNDGYAIRLRDVEVWFILDSEGLLDGYLVYEVGR